jgi:hypothetical protein
MPPEHNIIIQVKSNWPSNGIAERGARQERGNMYPIYDPVLIHFLS